METTIALSVVLGNAIPEAVSKALSMVEHTKMIAEDERALNLRYLRLVDHQMQEDVIEHNRLQDENFALEEQRDVAQRQLRSLKRRHAALKVQHRLLKQKG